MHVMSVPNVTWIQRLS